MVVEIQVLACPVDQEVLVVEQVEQTQVDQVEQEMILLYLPLKGTMVVVQSWSVGP